MYAVLAWPAPLSIRQGLWHPAMRFLNYTLSIHLRETKSLLLKGCPAILPHGFAHRQQLILQGPEALNSFQGLLAIVAPEDKGLPCST